MLEWIPVAVTGGLVCQCFVCLFTWQRFFKLTCSNFNICILGVVKNTIVLNRLLFFRSVDIKIPAVLIFILFDNEFTHAAEE